MTIFRFRSVLGLCLATTAIVAPVALHAAVCPTPNDDRAAAPARIGKPPVDPTARVMYDADALRRAGKRAEADAIYTRMLKTPADRRETSRRAALRLSQSALTRGDFSTARDFAARAAKGASAEIAAQATQLTRRISYAETIAARGAAYDAVAARRAAGAQADELVGAYNGLLAAPCPYPDDYHPRINLQLADVLAEKGDVDGARAALAQAKRETAALSDAERAARIRERASLSERDIDASLLIRQGDALADAVPADPAGAEAQYRQVLAMAPPPSISRLIGAHFGLSNLASDKGDFVTARAELDTAKAMATMATPEQVARVDAKYAQLGQREIDYKARARIDVAQSDARATPTQSLAILDEIIAQQPAPSPAVIQSAQLTQADILRRERFYVKSRTIARGVAASPQNERLAERAQNLLTRIDADTPKQSLHGSIVAGVNYDTNAPALVNSLRNEIDDDGYPNNQRFDDGSALARVTLDYRLRLNENGDQWRTRFVGTQTAQFSLERIDRTILDLETGPVFNIPSARMTVGIVGLFSTERRSGDFVQANYGAGINAERRLAGDMVLGGAYELTHRNDRRAGLDGTFHYGRLYLGDTVGLGQTLRGEVQLQYRNVTDPTLDSFRYGGSLNYSYNWGDRETLGYEFSIEPGYQFIDYRSFAGFRRKDERVTAQVDFTVTIRRQWQIGLLYALNNLDSNVAANERLANHRFGLRAGWLF